MSSINFDGTNRPASQTNAEASGAGAGQLTNAQRRKAKKNNNKKGKAPEAPKVEPAPVSFGEQLGRAMTQAPGSGVARPRARQASIDAVMAPDTPKMHLPLPVRVGAWLINDPKLGGQSAQKAQEVQVFRGGNRLVTGVMERLIVKYGHACHIGFFDNSYDVCVLNATKETDDKALVAFKVDHAHNVAVALGEPLCAPEHLIDSFEQFRRYCKSHDMEVAVIDADAELATYARSKSWEVMEFGREQCVNPMTTPLLGPSGNKVLRSIKSLMNKGVKFEVYNPADAINPELEAKIRAGYDAWSKSKCGSQHTAYATYLDVFKSPYATDFYYAKKDDEVLGFAGLVKIKDGYVIDPCIAFPRDPNATKYSGITDMLTYSVIAWLKEKNVTSVSFGLEPLAELRKVSGMSPWSAKITRRVHKDISAKIGLDGKRAYHDKFCPDPELQKELNIIVCQNSLLPPIGASMAILNTTHTLPAAKSVVLDYAKPGLHREQQREPANALDQQREPANALDQQREPANALEQQREPANALDQQRARANATIAQAYRVHSERKGRGPESSPPLSSHASSEYVDESPAPEGAVGK